MNSELSWDRLSRGTGVTGLVAIALVFAPTIALASLGEPPFDATADEAVTFLGNTAASSWAPTAMALQSAAALVLLWWAAALTHLMRRAEGEPSWRSTVALGSFVIFTAYVVLEPHWKTAAQIEHLDPTLALFAFDAGNIGFANAWLALGSFAVASGWAIVVTRMLSPKLGWLAIASGVGFLGARLVWTADVWLVPYALFWIWVIAVCIALVRGRVAGADALTPRGAAASEAPR